METDLDAGVEELLVVVGRQGRVSGGFEQAEGEVLGGAEAFSEQVGHRSPFVDELGEDAGDLQEEVCRPSYRFRRPYTRVRDCIRRFSAH